MTDYATLLRDHVTLKVGSIDAIDRIFLQACVPEVGAGQHCDHEANGDHLPSLPPGSPTCIVRQRVGCDYGYRSPAIVFKEPQNGIIETGGAFYSAQPRGSCP